MAKLALKWASGGVKLRLAPGCMILAKIKPSKSEKREADKNQAKDLKKIRPTEEASPM